MNMIKHFIVMMLILGVLFCCLITHSSMPYDMLTNLLWVIVTYTTTTTVVITQVGPTSNTDQKKKGGMCGACGQQQ